MAVIIAKLHAVPDGSGDDAWGTSVVVAQQQRGVGADRGLVTQGHVLQPEVQEWLGDEPAQHAKAALESAASTAASASQARVDVCACAVRLAV